MKTFGEKVTTRPFPRARRTRAAAQTAGTSRSGQVISSTASSRVSDAPPSVRSSTPATAGVPAMRTGSGMTLRRSGSTAVVRCCASQSGGDLKGVMRIGGKAHALRERDDRRLYIPAHHMDPVLERGHHALMPGRRHGGQLPPGVAGRIVGFEGPKRGQILIRLHVAA